MDGTSSPIRLSRNRLIAMFAVVGLALLVAAVDGALLAQQSIIFDIVGFGNINPNDEFTSLCKFAPLDPNCI